MLTLPIKKKWFDMILSGEKKEEYRNATPYYDTRFLHLFGGNGMEERKIRFQNGYSAQSPSFIATVTLTYGKGRPEWGAEQDKSYYVLHIKEIVSEVEP